MRGDAESGVQVRDAGIRPVSEPLTSWSLTVLLVRLVPCKMYRQAVGGSSPSPLVLMRESRQYQYRRRPASRGLGELGGGGRPAGLKEAY
jgi:hypothetical protein